MQDPKKSAGRLAFIDWTRGLAAVVMLQGHVFHSFTRTDLRDTGPYVLSQFLGGLPPAIFLFLTGITFAFLMHSQERRGATAWQRVVAALKRSRYLFLLAFLFRLQLYVFGFPTSPAGEILRVDILNCMGMAMLVLAAMAVFNTQERVRLCIVLGLLIAGLSPLISMIDASGVPWLIRSYFFPSYASFGFFPWASFLAFGMAAGSALRIVKQEDMAKAMLWTFGIGLALIVAAQYFSNLPYSIYPKSEFWLNSPGLIMIKLGVVLVVLSVAFVWVQHSPGQRWSLFRQFGTTSLLVYWVHIELVYGRWFGIWKEGLSLPQVATVAVVVTALMAALSVIRTRYTSGGYKSIGAFFRSNLALQTGSAAGD